MNQHNEKIRVDSARLNTTNNSTVGTLINYIFFIILTQSKAL